MEWENKVEMVRLGNTRYSSELSKKEFDDYVIANIESFDDQAWDMFVQLTDLLPEKMKEDIDYWTKIYRYIKQVPRTRCRHALCRF